VSGVQFPPSPHLKPFFSGGLFFFLVGASKERAFKCPYRFMDYYVYILQSKVNGSFYKGSTDNLFRRITEHNKGENPSTSRYAPWELVWFTKKPLRAEAIKLEMKLKNLSVRKTLDFILKYPSAI
jgi:putative endonuclease